MQELKRLKNYPEISSVDALDLLNQFLRLNTEYPEIIPKFVTVPLKLGSTSVGVHCYQLNSKSCANPIYNKAIWGLLYIIDTEFSDVAYTMFEDFLTGTGISINPKLDGYEHKLYERLKKAL